MGSPEVTRTGPLDMQVCIPKEWTDAEVVAFANQENLAGTQNGWHIRREGDAALNGDPERQQCAERPAYVHVMLDC